MGAIGWGCMTRPDLAYFYSVLGRHNARWATRHWLAAKRVLRYIKRTVDLSIHYGPTESLPVGEDSRQFYSDADWAGCKETRKSTTGYVFLLAGGAVCWKSTRQMAVALSSTEAEYMALGDAVRHAIWWRRLLSETLGTRGPIKLKGDNQGSHFLAEGPTFHRRTKHIDIRHHFIRDQVDKKDDILEHVPTAKMVADCLTKPLPREKLETCRRCMGLRN